MCFSDWQSIKKTSRRFDQIRAFVRGVGGNVRTNSPDEDEFRNYVEIYCYCITPHSMTQLLTTLDEKIIYDHYSYATKYEFVKNH